MLGRSATAIEKKWLNIIKQIPCIVCELYHNAPDSPAEIHHLNGQRTPNAHLRSISLCARHHRIKDDHKPPRWISRHGDGRMAFEREYANETILWEAMKERVQSLEPFKYDY